MSGQKIVIAGAGSVGCFVGGLLAHGGKPVTLLGRGALAAQVADEGMQLTDPDGLALRLSAEQARLVTDPACLAGADIVLVCVKSGATAEMAQVIAMHAPQAAIIVSLQNGVTNADVLRAALPGRAVRAGMVGYNVVQLPGSRFHRGTDGEIMIEAGRPGLAEVLRVPGLDVADSDEIAAVQWGKLLLNLNNALNALSGLPLKTQLQDRRWRRVLADMMGEALAAMDAAGIHPKAASPLPPKRIPSVLRLPTWVFRIVAARMLKIEPEARSSMWEDLQRGRMTEIDSLQGAIVALGAKHGVETPVNAQIVACVKAAEGRPPRAHQPSEVEPRYG